MNQPVLQISSKCCCYFIFCLYQPSRICYSGAWTHHDVATTLDVPVRMVTCRVWCSLSGRNHLMPDVRPIVVSLGGASFRLVPLFITTLLIVLVSSTSQLTALNLYSRHRRHKDTFGLHANTLDMWNWRNTLFHLWESSALLPHSLLTHLLWGITVTTMNITPLICSF